MNVLFIISTDDAETAYNAMRLASFHPEMALFRNLCVNLRNYLCGVPLVRLRVIP